jgi:putative addiction module component (TIGR02574 family)
MSAVNISAILKLPVEERLHLVELIWESLTASSTALPLSDAHRAVIEKRLAEHNLNPDDVVSRDEILAEARRG